MNIFNDNLKYSRCSIRLFQFLQTFLNEIIFSVDNSEMLHPLVNLSSIYIFSIENLGEVQEWLNWLPWKGSVLARVPWVRIPPSPHNCKAIVSQSKLFEDFI